MKRRMLASGLILAASVLTLSACSGPGLDAKDPKAVKQAIETQLKATGGDHVFSIDLNQRGNGSIGYRKGDAKPAFIGLTGGKVVSEAGDFMTGATVDKLPITELVKMTERAGEKCSGKGFAEAVILPNGSILINGHCPKESGPPMLQSFNGKDISAPKDLTDPAELEQNLAVARTALGNESTGVRLTIFGDHPDLSVNGPVVETPSGKCQLSMGFGYPSGVVFSPGCTPPNELANTQISLDQLTGQKLVDAMTAGAKEMGLGGPKEIKYVDVVAEKGHLYADMSAAQVMKLSRIEIK